MPGRPRGIRAHQAGQAAAAEPRAHAVPEVLHVRAVEEAEAAWDDDDVLIDLLIQRLPPDVHRAHTRRPRWSVP